jgi:hypothetical protein
MEDKNSDNLKILARCISDIEAELIVRLLEDNGIESFVETNIPHSVWPVSAEDYDKAKQILKENIENQELIVDEENTNNFSEEEGE